MTWLSRFFDQISGYDQEQFAEVFATVHTNGVDPTKLNKMAVVAQDPAVMKVNVSSGEGWVQGHWCRNTAAYEIAISAADATYDRIDVVVLRMTAAGSPGTVIAALLTGTPAASPAVPALTQNVNVWEIALAQILVGHGVTSIVSGVITDRRINMASGGVSLMFSEGGDTLPTGLAILWEVPCACQILGYTLVASPSGSIIIDIHKGTYAAYPTTASICASALPTIASGQKTSDFTLTGWTTTLNEGDWLEFYIDSVTSVTRATLSLRLARLATQ